MEDKKLKILNFISSKKLTVISTINKQNHPESAVVAFSQNSNLELIFGTSSTSRKYKNLQNNNRASLVIGWEEDEKITVQYEGIAIQLKGNEKEEARQAHLKKNPGSKKFDSMPTQTYFKIIPKWIRYSSLSISPPEIFEISF
ncbi:MAG: pyridoxamine 5'-phosphate oxidase family protein [Nanoarchaeota archaeon]|nr:pyridoxamine 5'-phosphate oxidase family protein [Nanoarchaeota archaeon]